MAWHRGTWVGGLAEWVEGDTAFLSIAFTWKLDEAYQRALWFKSLGMKVRAGGPATFTRKHHLADVAEIGGTIPDALQRHNQMETKADRKSVVKGKSVAVRVESGGGRFIKK